MVPGGGLEGKAGRCGREARERRETGRERSERRRLEVDGQRRGLALGRETSRVEREREMVGE